MIYFTSVLQAEYGPQYQKCVWKLFLKALRKHDKKLHYSVSI